MSTSLPPLRRVPAAADLLVDARLAYPAWKTRLAKVIGSIVNGVLRWSNAGIAPHRRPESHNCYAPGRGKPFGARLKNCPAMVIDLDQCGGPSTGDQ